MATKKRDTEPATATILLKKLKTLEKQIIELASVDESSNDKFISFKAGTQYFTTLRSTIDRYPESMIYTMVNGAVPTTRVNDAIFIDMNPKRFEMVLDFMQTSFPPAMTTQQQENFEEDVTYFLLPYTKPLSSTEKKWKQQVDEWLTFEANKINFFYHRWYKKICYNIRFFFELGNILKDSEFEDMSKDILNEFSFESIYTDHFCHFCDKTARKPIKIEEFAIVLRYLGCQIENYSVIGIKISIIDAVVVK